MAVGFPSAFHLLAKPTGAVCNLDCSYCFFLSKEMLYPGSRFRMADELLEAYLQQLIEAHAGVPEVVIAWQGGEPTLMGLDFFRRSVELTEKHLRPGQRAVITIQTNGTLLDAEWCEFFKENNVLVGISIDGPREIHDAYRVNKGGRGSFDEVMRGLDHLRTAGVDWNVLTTVHAVNGDRGREIYRFLRDECGAKFIQFIPIIERATKETQDGAPRTSWRDRPLYVQEGSYVTNRTVAAKQYGRFLIDVFEEWVRRDVGEVYVQMFDVALANWVGEPPVSACIPRRAGQRSRSSTPVTSTHAIISWNPGSVSATSRKSTCSSSSRRNSRCSSGSTSATRCRSTASTAMFASPATAAVRRTASSRRPRETPA